MPKLLQDPKVVDLIAKAAAKAVKAETNRVLILVKEAKNNVKYLETKEHRLVVTKTLKELEAKLKLVA